MSCPEASVRSACLCFREKKIQITHTPFPHLYEEKGGNSCLIDPEHERKVGNRGHWFFCWIKIQSEQDLKSISYVWSYRAQMEYYYYFRTSFLAQWGGTKSAWHHAPRVLKAATTLEKCSEPFCIKHQSQEEKIVTREVGGNKKINHQKNLCFLMKKFPQSQAHRWNMYKAKCKAELEKTLQKQL